MKKKDIVARVMDAAGLQFGNRTVERHIADVFNTVAGQLFRSQPSQWEFYSLQETITVQDRVSTIEKALIQTPQASNGVPRITDYCGETVFHPVTPSQLNMKVDANRIGQFVFYSVTGNEIRFNKSFPMGEARVIATIIPEFHEYDDDFFINLPAGVAQMIIDGAVASLRGEQAGKNIYKK